MYLVNKTNNSYTNNTEIYNLRLNYKYLEIIFVIYLVFMLVNLVYISKIENSKKQY